MKSNLILGVSGQDGRLLSERLIADGQRVVGVSRAAPLGFGSFSFDHAQFSWARADLLEEGSLWNILKAVNPSTIYNLAGFSHVGDSWANEEISNRINYAFVKELVYSIEKMADKGESVPFLFHASSFEVFGKTTESPQNEETPFSPVTPYGRHKAMAHDFLRESRQNRGLRTGIGLSYNHESPLRPPSFVSRKISIGVNRIARGEQHSLTLGNLDSQRDWGYAGDYVRAMEAIVARQLSEDFVIATGLQHSISDFLSIAFGEVGIEDWQARVVTDPNLVRPNDPARLLGCPKKAHQALAWRPEVSFDELVRMMVNHDFL